MTGLRSVKHLNANNENRKINQILEEPGAGILEEGRDGTRPGDMQRLGKVLKYFSCKV